MLVFTEASWLIFLTCIECFFFLWFTTSQGDIGVFVFSACGGGDKQYVVSLVGNETFEKLSSSTLPNGCLTSILRVLETLHLLCRGFFLCVFLIGGQQTVTIISHCNVSQVKSSFFSATVCLIQFKAVAVKCSCSKRSLGAKILDWIFSFFLEPYFHTRRVEILGILCWREGGASRKTYGESGAEASNHLLNHPKPSKKKQNKKKHNKKLLAEEGFVADEPPQINCRGWLETWKSFQPRHREPFNTLPVSGLPPRPRPLWPGQRCVLAQHLADSVISQHWPPFLPSGQANH